MTVRFARIVALALTSFPAGLAAAEEKSAEGAPRPIYKTAEPLKIDGVLDEPVWQKSEPIPVEWTYGKKGNKAATPNMLVRYAWDGDYFYVGYETFDKNLVAIGNGKQEGAPGNPREGCEIGHPEKPVDVVEFFISFGDLDFFWELHHNALNQFNDIWISSYKDDQPTAKSALNRFAIHFGVNETLPDDEPAGAKFAMAVKLKPGAGGKASTVNDSSDEDAGYVGELRFPWIGLGTPTSAETHVTVEPKEPNGKKTSHHGPWKLAGQEMIVLGVCQNGDLEQRYSHTSPNFEGGWFHKGSKLWPRYVLVEK